jgi:hypothetical protein
MYIVAKDNPYFPSVEYCASLDEAKVIYDKWKDDVDDPDGFITCRITISEVLTITNVKCSY